MKKGKLIVFEGISGTGKETQAKLLKAYLFTKGIISQIVYHPSPELKEVLSKWRKEKQINAVSETYFLLADRYNTVQNVIGPALEKGHWVISLRNWISALVYQAKTEKEREWITEEFAWFEPKPDYLFYFDIRPAEALKRIIKRHNEIREALGTFETKNLLNQKRNNYLRILKNISHNLIDATRSIEQVHKVIVNKLF